jgi:tyrosine-protein kinase Etk/Wzc
MPPRLPGSNGYRQLASNGAAGMPPPQPPGGGGMSGADVWRVIRTNLWLIILMVIFAGGCGFGANWLLAKYYPRYTADGLLQVVPPQAVQLLPDSSVQQFSNSQFLETDQQTQVQLMMQPSLYGRALTNNEALRKTEWFKQFDSVNDAKQDLMKHFSVSAIPQTSLIQVSMPAALPQDAKVIVEAVVNQHLRDQQEDIRDQTLDQTRQLNNLHNQYKILLDDKTAQMRRSAIELNINGAGVPGRLSAKEIELGELVRKQLDLQMLDADAEGMFNSTRQQIQNNEVPQQIQDLIEHDPDILNFRQTLVGVELRLQEMLSKYGPEYQGVQSVQRQKEYFQRKLNDRKAELVASNSAQMIETLRSQVSAIKDKLKAVNDKVQGIKKDMGDISNQMATYLTLMDEQKGYRELLKQVDDQLDAIQNTTDRPMATADWKAHPDLPDKLSFPRLPITMALALALGLGLSLGIAFLRELMDTSVRSPRDVARVGQLTLLGMVPDEADDPQAGGVKLPLVIAEAPHSMLAEQFRQIRTRLQHAASLDTTRSILVTSASPGDGKSTVSCNLAAGLALNGRRILLVDADFRRPGLHAIFGLGNDHGFSEALGDMSRFDSLVRPTHVPNLSVLPCGPRPANATEQLESQLFTDFIERALEDFDHIIFDSGALLLASETLAMAPRVDGVVTVVRARANSRGLLQRLRDALKQVKAEHLGVILNAVRSQGGGYYARNIKMFYNYHKRQ